ncbi:basement membrane-specific heparan sulfate proteoglycan core protein isoform X5 [Polyergus mexicanus]|uniref:basement membrane-specific heparan sulfate proteoglycan core protein isoform X5 n=1 Tax=Polyergus mexicanus TaxID=615972 RepID=UPI0038B62AF6
MNSNKMKNRVLLKSALFLLLIAADGLVTASEDDDLIFDPEGKQPVVQAPMIETHQDETLLHRIKRGFFDLFSAPSTTTQASPEDRDQDQTFDNSVILNGHLGGNEGNHTLDQPETPSAETSIGIERLTLEKDEDNDEEDDEHDNEISNVAESQRIPITYGNSDDEDLAGSGELEGSANEEREEVGRHPNIINQHHNVNGKARFYRITLTVGEPYRREYSDRNSPEYRELSGNLTHALENLYNRYIPGYHHFASVVKISPTSDAFTSQVTLDIGSTFTDELEVRAILDQQLQYHSLDGIQVGPEGFTFRIFQAREKSDQPECDQTAELRCRSGECVPLESRCDSILQCNDGSDEDNCPTDSLNRTSDVDEHTTVESQHSGYFPVYSNVKERVLPSEVKPKVSNIEDDDREDEVSTLRSSSNMCRADDTVRCQDGSRHICSVQQCDGVPDCDDGGDEVGCPHPGCSAGEFACDVNRCILESQRCNFVEDCQDGSDEHDCSYPVCSPTEFICRNGQCIDSNRYCNGVHDCYDGSDEHNCPRCRADEFECASGSCVSKSARCDGRNDCLDHSDEYNCNVTTCSGDQFRCLDGICLSIDKRCNGIPDCRNGEDEHQCGCGDAEFRCTDGRCIGYELQCNGVNECPDGSDERDCEKYPWRHYNNTKKFDAIAWKLWIFYGRKPIERRRNMNMKPETTKSVYRLTIKPTMMIGNPILEAFPEEAQRRKFPNSTLQNFSTYSTRIATKSKNNEPNSSSQHDSNNAEFGRFRKSGMRNCNGNIKIRHLTNNRALPQLTEFQTSNPKFLKLSDNLIRSLLRLKHNDISSKDIRLQFINNQNRTRKIKNESIFDHKSRKSDAFNSNVTINFLSSSKKDRYATEKNIFNMKNWNIKIKNNTSLKNKEKYWNNINWTETRLEKDQKKVKNISNRNHIIFNNIKRPHRFEDTILKAKKNDTVTPLINDWIYKFITKVRPTFRLNNSTATEISNKTISRMVTVVNDTDIDRNLSVIDVNRTQFKKTVFANMSTTEKIHENYSSMKIEKLLYESKSPNVELHRYFPTINQTFISTDSIDKISIDSLISNHKSIQQNRDRGKKKYSTRKMSKQSNSTFERFYESNGSSTESNDKIDTGFINSNETPESITIDYVYSKELRESKEILEKGLKDDVLLNWAKASSTKAPDIVTRNENKSRMEETEKHGKHKYKDRHNGCKNNRPKKGKKNHNANHKRKPTSITAWMVDETTSVDYSNDYSSEQRKTMSSRNDSGYDKADGNRNTSTDKSDWHLTDEITTEPLKMESSSVDESVTEHLTKDNTEEGLWSKRKTNTDLITDDTTFHSSTAFKGKKFKKCKIRITTITENSWWYVKKVDNNEDEELINCEDVTSFPVTGDSEDNTEIGNYNIFTNDDYLFAYEKISTSTSAISSLKNFKSKKNDELSNIERSTTHDTITNQKNKDRNSTREKSILDNKNNERTSEWSWNRESTTHPIKRTITHDAISNLDSLEEEDSIEKPMSSEDNEIDNDVVEDYETDNCNKNQYACDKYTCIDDDQVCDGIVDCINASDEIDCDYIYIERWEEYQRINGQLGKFDLPFQNSIEDTSLDGCSRYEHPCDGRCINALNVCDDKRDCLDGTDEEGCSNLEECPDGQLPCDNGVCINKNFFCDQNVDCHDASDERDCPDREETGSSGRECHPDSFTCNDGSCIPRTAVCDGRVDCPHDEDEINCRQGCTRDQFQCANGDCIPANQRCNGYIECADGSDEPEECEQPEKPGPGQCVENQFMCISDRRCVPQSSVCNGIPECRDGSDEHNCDQGAECSDEEWQCKSGDCIPRHRHCDRRIDCPYDDSDELGCHYRSMQRNHSICGTHEWTCNDDHCIPLHQRCDKRLDCPRDMSDEMDCSYDNYTDVTSDLRLKTYPSEQVIKENPAKQGREVVFQCRDEGLLRARVRWIRGNGLPLPPGSRDINGRLEIPNIQLEHAGTYICEAMGYPPSTPGRQVNVILSVEKFEQPATRPPQVCQYDQATCSNGDCIPKSYVCDGKFDCTDGSDEMRCSPHGCEPNEFRCNNKQCVSKLWRCDGDKDCADGSDEENCAPSPPGSPCRYNEFPCNSNKQCIPKSYHCDMERDCLDGSDEVGCSPVYIVKPPPPMVVLEPGEMLLLTCTAIGVPIPEINWRLNWGHIPAKCTTVSTNGTGTLTCPDIQIQDQGAYSCEALNVGGFVFAVPDAIVVVKEPRNVCPKGKFNSEAKVIDECISCFCFGVATECRSADLFTYQIPPPLDRHKIVSVETVPTIKIHGDISNQISQIRPIGRDGVQLLESFSNELNVYNVPYFALPENYHGSQLKSYGGYLKYSIRHSGNGTPNNAPTVILSGNNYILVHKGKEPTPEYETEESVRFFYGDWYKQQGRSEVPASREEIMMTLANVDNILIKVKYDDSPQLDVRLTNIVVDTADARNTGLGSASFVEECQCPTGYTGLSCEHCAPGYLRRESGPWLGQCYRDEPPCPPGYYGDPSRNIPCQICPCPLTNPSNQFARTCHLGSDGQPTCDCPAGYVGRRCEQCAAGYQGNPLIPGDMCVPLQQCDPNGSLSPNADPHTGKCHCKQYATGLTCNQCKANTFNLASTNQFGCIACFCMGITNRCVSSNWYRNEIRVSFTNSIRDFSLIESKSTDAPAIVEGIHLNTISREIIYSDFPNRGNNDVYYWQLPSIFLGDQITSYGGNLKYTVRYVPSPGGQSSRNNAADVELISANDINLLYYSRESPEPNSQQSFTVPLLEQYWQRNDGTQADREHLLMALADVRAIRIKATYTTHTDEAALSFVSLDTAEKYNTGKARAVEVEECTCPSGYRGLSCEDCDVGYTRAIEGLYLGICEPCNCNGHSNQCDPEIGTCENCAHHTTGDYCEVCESGYEGDASRGTPNDCTYRSSPEPCRCNEAGSRGALCVDGRCECKRNVEGPECNRCRPSTYGLRAENIDGCIECYCSGVTDQCHESTLYIQQIPMWVYDSHHGFTLTDSTRRDIIDDGFELNVAMNEIGYRYPDSRSRRLFWSLPSVFTGNKVKSYGGNLTLTQHITAYPGAQSYKDQDILLIGNGITLFWTNPTELQPDIPLTYSVPLKENEWKRLTTEGPRSASRTDLMIVLSNLEAILVRASHSERMTATYISDISMDTAVENLTGERRATQIEACRCPTGYAGTSCEICTRGYYRDTSDRSVSYLGACNLCPCNKNEESCEISRSGQVKCHCLPGYTGQYCQDSVVGELMVSLMPMKGEVEPYSTIQFTCNYDYPDMFYIYFKLSPLNGFAITARGDKPGHIVKTKKGAFRKWSVHVGRTACNVECHIVNYRGKELVKIVTSITPVGEPQTTITPGPIPPPRIIVYIQEPEFQIVHTGNTVRYHCSGRSIDSNSVNIRWEKEGGQLPLGRSVDDANGLLVIRDVKVSDSGIYVCQVSDGINIGRKRVTLTVGGANSVEPRIVISPSYQQVREGEPVEFRCEATGNPPPELDWIRVHGSMSPEATFYNGIWSLPAASKNDAAEYKCIAKNNIGVDEKTTILYVQDNPNKPPPQGLPPTVTPSEWSGTIGDVVRLICTPSQHANVTWTRSGGLPLPYTASQQDGILTITNPNPNDSGIYVCTATSIRGTETSTSARITIIPRRDPPTVKVRPERQEVSQGTIAEVRCITSGEPDVHVKWSKYTETMSSRVQQVGDTLRIINAQVSDRGVYICRVTSSTGSYEASAIIEVEPREAPVLELYPQDVQTVILGGSADLQCRAKAGFPVPELHWSRQDGRPFASNIEQLPGGLLRLSNITVNDDGAYICSASNEVGSTSVIAHIEVQSLPVITITPKHGILQVKRGSRVRLMCSASGYPQPNVAWSKYVHGVTVYDTYSRTAATPLSAVYEIFSVSSDDEGSYTCQATNAVGIAEERIQIRIDDDDDYAPCTGERGDIPCDDQRPDNRDPNQQGVLIPKDYLRIPNGGKVEMRCQVLGLDGDQIYLDWKRSDHRSLPEGSTVHNGVLSIPTVDRNAAGEYICLGLDPAGTVLFRAKSHLEIISPPRIELNPTRQTVGPGENPSIICTATGDEPLHIVWDAIGRPLPYSVSHNRGILQFHGITYSDAGKYVCKAMNGAGTAEAVAEVLVNEHSYDDTEVRAEQRDVVTHAGNSVRLRCVVRERATIHWSREGRDLPSTARIGEDYLELTQVKPEDSGRYICQAQTSRGVSSDYINFNVSLYRSQCRHWEYECRSLQCIPMEYFCDGYVQCNDGTDERFCRIARYRQYLQRRRAAVVPSISVEVSQDPVNIGDTIDIHCTCTGRSPRYHWSRPNHVSLPTNAQEYSNVLRLTNVAVTDSGPYRCIVDTPEGTFEKDFNLIVHGGILDEPAIETKFAPHGSSLEMDCRIDLDPPIQFQWSKLGGLLPRDTQTLENKLKLTNVKAEDAGTYICVGYNGQARVEVPTVLVVTGVVPNFSQAPESYIAFPPLPDSYLKFNIEISFKPENYDGILLYNAESVHGNDDFIALSLVNGYPQFKFNLGSGPAVVRADKPVTLSDWHTIKIQRNRKEATMLVDGESSYKVIAVGRRQGLDLKEPLYIGGVPSYSEINKQSEVNTGFVGCISRLVLGEKQVDLIGDQTDSVGITSCETCAENPCNNGGVCQEAATKNGYTCLCRAGFSGKHCDYVGQSCYPGACGEGKCVDKDVGFDCYCPIGKTGSRCEHSINIHDPAFRNERAYLAYETPKALRRLKVTMSFNPMDSGDGILMYCSQNDEGLGDFAALIIKDKHIEFRFDIGSGMATVRSSYAVQPGVWTYVTMSRDFKKAKLSVNGEPSVEAESPGASRTMILNTPLYVGGMDRRKITINRNVGVNRSFRGCISELEVLSVSLDILKSSIDAANIENCSMSHLNQTIMHTTVTTLAPSTQPPTTLFDPCAWKPCIHGICQSSDVYDYSCTCEYGYVGRNCENVLKQCELLTPCKNGGSCTDLHGSYKCDCRLGYNGQNCEKLAEITYDVAFKGDGWLELDRSVMTHEEEREVLGLEISTNKSNGLIMWHGQTLNDLTPDDYIAVAVVDGYVEYQYNLGSGPAVIRVTAQRVDDGERHRIILKRQGSDGSIELNGEHTESGVSDGLQQILNARGSVYLGGLPDYAMAYGRYHDGFSGCIYTLEVQDSGAIDIGEKTIRGVNVSPCTRVRWIPSSLVFTDADADVFDAFVPPPPVNIIHPKPASNLAACDITSYSLLIILQNLIALTRDIKEQSVLFALLCVDVINVFKGLLS